MGKLKKIISVIQQEGLTDFIQKSHLSFPTFPTLRDQVIADADTVRQFLVKKGYKPAAEIRTGGGASNTGYDSTYDSATGDAYPMPMIQTLPVMPGIEDVPMDGTLHGTLPSMPDDSLLS